MQIITNTGKVDIQDVVANGGSTVVNFVYMNRVLVWQRMMTIVLDQQSSYFNLRSYINNHNPLNNKDIVVVNNLVQPSLETGDLNGLNIIFVNNFNKVIILHSLISLTSLFHT